MDFGVWGLLIPESLIKHAELQESNTLDLVTFFRKKVVEMSCLKFWIKLDQLDDNGNQIAYHQELQG